MNGLDIKLSEGSLETIMSGGEVPQPIMQILGNKKIAGNSANERYRLLISDGVHLNSFAMLATQLNDKITDGSLADFSVIRINRHIVSVINNAGKADKRVMVILDLTILVKGPDVGMKIGNPEPLNEAGTTRTSQSSNNISSAPSPASRPPTRPVNGGLSNTNASNRSLVRNDPLNSSMNSGMTHPIVSLSPYQNRWTIKARVTNKSGIRTWSNARGDGKLFSVDLIDESGEIRATAFNEQCDKFYDMLQMNKVYLISKCQLKTANKKFSSLNNEYEMSFTRDTTVVPVEEEDESIPTIAYNFVPLSSIPESSPDALVDIIGVCVNSSDVQKVVSRTTQRELKKRDVSLVDQSLTRIDLTLWGNQAEEFDGSSEPVLAVKGGKIGEFNGSRSISLMATSSLQINPDIEEAYKLRGWFDTQDRSSMDFKNVSARVGGADSMDNKVIVLREFRDNQLGGADKPDYFSIYGTITHVRSENALYQSCPQPDCNKKVIDQNNGLYRCEKCSKEFDRFQYRMLLNVHVSDWSGEVWVTMFQEAAEQIIGMSAEELGQKKEENGDLGLIFKKVCFKEYLLRLRAKQDTYNDETRVRVTAVSVKTPNRKAYNSYLLNEIKQLSGIGTTVS